MLPEIRVAKIINVEAPTGLRNRAWVLALDVGEKDTKKSVGQFTNLAAQELLGMHVIAVVGLGNKKIGNYISECLVLGTQVGIDHNDGHMPLQPDPSAPLGQLVT